MVVKEDLQDLIGKYEKLILSIKKPVTDEEARVLVTVFGPDDSFGLVWPLVGLVESAPGLAVSWKTPITSGFRC